MASALDEAAFSEGAPEHAAASEPIPSNATMAKECVERMIVTWPQSSRARHEDRTDFKQLPR
jgi:hypothetical protein